MTNNHVLFAAACTSAMLMTGCTSVPKAPTVSGYNRTPVNSQTQVDLQACKSDLSNTKLLLNETARLADSASTALSQVAARCAVPKVSPSSVIQGQPTASPIPAVYHGATSAQEPAANTVLVLHFPYGRSAVDLTDESAIALSASAKSAALIVIRGRTDGTRETLGEARVARERAEAVRQYLVALGIADTRIRTTWQAIGDSVASNATEQGRALNRRAEVEVYRTLPEKTTLAQVDH